MPLAAESSATEPLPTTATAASGTSNGASAGALAAAIDALPNDELSLSAGDSGSVGAGAGVAGRKEISGGPNELNEVRAIRRRGAGACGSAGAGSELTSATAALPVPVDC